jgi:L-lactate dehydrogenase complex protein LldF
MTVTNFRARIRRSISNPALQAALDANAERRRKGRLDAFASLPDWRARRQRAHAVRADVIQHLDKYLEQFIEKVAGNGILVHRAQDAAEAVKLVLNIVKNPPQAHANPMENHKENGVHWRSSVMNPALVAKSKSMVSEEINLNHALEAQGIRVVETDLGEYIVQLRGERPSHIITPAVHLRRQEVGQLFHEKLGIPYTEDIPTLTDTARKVLREVFLTAQVGLSGVNFGVVESGTLCIVTNEGNGRMVTTLPPVHIALMGMERLVPTLEDLALMLTLLPRSATGQKLSVYTQFLQRPLEGQQRHLIILDNGRSALRASPLAESLYCIRCGACLNACPVFRELGGHAYGSVYPGPIGSVISAGLFGSDFLPLAQASSLCGACKDACPVDIDLPKLLTRVRAGMSPSPFDGRVGDKGQAKSISSSSKFYLWIYGRLAREPRSFAIAQSFAALATHLVSPFSEWIRLPGFTGWGYSKDLPRFASRPFRRSFLESNSLPLESGAAHPERNDFQSKKVQTSEAIVENNKIEQFIRELTAVSGHVTRVSKEELSDKLIEFLRFRGVERIQLEPGILEASLLNSANITASAEPDPAIQLGVTKAIYGLADTGSLVIIDGEGYPLYGSLLPEIHVAVLQASNILVTLTNALALPRVRESRSAVVITGPSRTGDIEMSHTIGVHGPGELHVFLVDDSIPG